jgi:ABC-2 type transport system permease protein
VNVRAIKAIALRDLKLVRQSKIVLLPLIVLPVIFLVVLPAFVGLIPQFAEASGMPMDDLDAILSQVPSDIATELAGLSENQKFVYLMTVYFMAPLFLILPLMVASVIAADSFAGEKERKTMEALLYSPTTDGELFVAKMLSAWVPSVIISIAGMLVYSVVVNISAWPMMGRIFLPNAMWVALAFWVGPAVAGLGLGSTMLISSKVNSFQEAYQGGAVVVVPVIALVISQATGVMYLSFWLVLLLGLGLWIIVAFLLWFGARTFQRSEVIARLS